MNKIISVSMVIVLMSASVLGWNQNLWTKKHFKNWMSVQEETMPEKKASDFVPNKVEFYRMQDINVETNLPEYSTQKPHKLESWEMLNGLEDFLGRLAMTCFTVGLLNEFLSGKSLMEQTGLTSYDQQANFFYGGIIMALSSTFILMLNSLKENEIRNR